MSLLAPLYFLGALAVSLPILFHLIRRQPKGQVEFSSVMFLQPTPPRLTRRSRLDNWPLLLLRALALMLLAAAFARPFFRSVALSDAELPGRKLVLLMDTSASMQRAGLWQQALDRARDVISDLQPADRLAIVTFDREPKTLIGFEQSSKIPPSQVKATANSLLSEAAPTWHQTELGRAISYAGDLAASFEPDDAMRVGGAGDRVAGVGDAGDTEQASDPPPGSTGPAHLVLITDMQSGSRIESLQVYAWPQNLRLDVRKVVPQSRTNASAQILAAAPEMDADQERVRVRVTNAPDSTDSRFQIGWSTASTSGGNSAGGTGSAGDGGQKNLTELPVQVPPGQSRVVRMPSPTPGVTSLVLRGDDHSFDNARYLVSPQPESFNLIHIGQTPDDPRDSLGYYLQRVPLSNVRRNVSVQLVTPQSVPQIGQPKETPLIVVSDAVTDATAAALRDYVSAGGRVLMVLGGEQTIVPVGQSINAITGGQLRFSEAVIEDYVMLSRIDFSHPVFQPMADPKFNDFTKVRFWSHRTISGLDDSWNVVSRFDDGDPALIERVIDDGSLFVLAAGWNPSASQLAMSTKFIPLVFALFESEKADAGANQYFLGQQIDFEPSDTATITGPTGTAFKYVSRDDADAIDQPGIYRFEDGDTKRTFAVNLSETESRTDPIGEDQLERFGVILGKNVSTELALQRQRQLRDRELESQQKLWQWLLVAALALLGLETFLGMLWSRRRPDQQLGGAEQQEVRAAGV